MHAPFPFETLVFWIFSCVCVKHASQPGTHTVELRGWIVIILQLEPDKEDFTHITLLEAHNTKHNYDIIPLSETSLNVNVQVPELPGYKLHLYNHSNGNRSVGVGIFCKESLSLKIREDISFNDCIVCKHVFLQYCIEIQSTKKILLNSNSLKKWKICTKKLKTKNLNPIIIG